ncbi:MAG: hypothetical protein ACTSO4_13125 [Promethearchaeota archaeon]
MIYIHYFYIKNPNLGSGQISWIHYIESENLLDSDLDAVAKLFSILHLCLEKRRSIFPIFD